MEEFYTSKSIEQIRDEKLGESYLYGEGRKYILLNGVRIWKSPAERDNYLMTVQSAKRLGVQSIPFMGAELPVDKAQMVIDAANVYGLQVTAIMEAHEAAIKALENEEEITAYDHTTGYPEIISYPEL